MPHSNTKGAIVSLADSNKTNTEQPSEEQVATYLSNHPGFFLKHEDLLANIKLSHASGSATSLLERQVNVLRERNIDVRSRLGSLLENAVVNDSLFDKSQDLVLAALETKNTAGLCKAVYQQLLENFDIDFVGINLFHAEPGVSRQYARPVAEEKAKEAVGGLLSANKTICGPLRANEALFLFGAEGEDVASAAVIPLNFQGSHGILAIGSKNQQHFTSDMSTDFVDYIAAVISRLLFRGQSS